MWRLTPPSKVPEVPLDVAPELLVVEPWPVAPPVVPPVDAPDAAVSTPPLPMVAIDAAVDVETPVPVEEVIAPEIEFPPRVVAAPAPVAARDAPDDPVPRLPTPLEELLNEAELWEEVELAGQRWRRCRMCQSSRWLPSRHRTP